MEGFPGRREKPREVRQLVEFEWNDSLRIGDETLDRQHRDIIRVINRFLDLAPHEPGSEAVSDILNELIRYAREHFEAEEELLEKYDYPELEAHRLEHEDFLKRTVSMIQASMAGLPSLSDLLVEFSSDWLGRHVLEEDMKIRDFLKTVR